MHSMTGHDSPLTWPLPPPRSHATPSSCGIDGGTASQRAATACTSTGVRPCTFLLWHTCAAHITCNYSVQ